MSIQNQRKFCDSIGEKIGVINGDLSPWYNMTFTEFINFGGNGMTSHYKSLYPMLVKVFPDYKWEPWRFKFKPRSLTNSPEFIKSILEETEKRLNIIKFED